MDKNDFDLNDYVGEMGAYQLRVCVVIFLYTMYATDVTQFIFVAASMPHWCRVPELDDLPHEVQKNVAIPALSTADDGSVEYSACEMFSLNYSVYNRSEFSSWNRSLMITNETSISQCSEWTYDQSLFISTVVRKVRSIRDR